MALSFSKILWGLLMALSPVIVGGDCGQLILVWRWWMALGWLLLMVSFFWCIKQL
ncbi:hypothetical protein [Bartonella sp. AP281QHHD]|uniref:hypothetical protein n=1 Tax=Bartonella sp. AP281QHHD TaxID=3243481 RepID=UPI0035D0A1D3